MMQGRQYIQNSEFMAIADANNMIILFPQAAFVPNSVSGFLQCWDMIGFTEKDGDGYYWGKRIFFLAKMEHHLQHCVANSCRNQTRETTGCHLQNDGATFGRGNK